LVLCYINIRPQLRRRGSGFDVRVIEYDSSCTYICIGARARAWRTFNINFIEEFIIGV